MKGLIKNKLEVKATTSNAEPILQGLPMLIKKYNVAKFNIKRMSKTAAIFTFITKNEPPRDMIRTISKKYKDLFFLLEYEGDGIDNSMYLVKNDEVLNEE